MKYVNHYNTVEFYVGDITEPQTIKIYTDLNVFDNVQVSEGNKWYSYLFPKDKSLCKIESGTYDSDNYAWSNGIVTKAVVKKPTTSTTSGIITVFNLLASQNMFSDTYRRRDANTAVKSFRPLNDASGYSCFYRIKQPPTIEPSSAFSACSSVAPTPNLSNKFDKVSLSRDLMLHVLDMKLK